MVLVWFRDPACGPCLVEIEKTAPTDGHCLEEPSYSHNYAVTFKNHHAAISEETKRQKSLSIVFKKRKNKPTPKFNTKETVVSYEEIFKPSPPFVTRNEMVVEVLRPQKKYYNKSNET